MERKDANPAGISSGAAGSGNESENTQRMPATSRRPPFDLRNLFDFELADLEARYRWLVQQPDLNHPDETTELIWLWLNAIRTEWKRRQGFNLKSPTPNHGITPELIARLKDHADLVRLVEDEVQLRRMGNSFRGCCPFCDSHNPTALAVSERVWHCFRCREGGDVYTWLMLSKRIDFVDAVRWLAALLGEPIPVAPKFRRKNQPVRTRIEGGKVVVE